MRRTAGLALRAQGRGSSLAVSSNPAFALSALSRRPLSTSADELLDLFKQAAAKGPSNPSAQPPRPAAGRGRIPSSADSGNWAKQMANQLDDTSANDGATPQLRKDHKREKNFRPARQFDPLRGGQRPRPFEDAFANFTRTRRSAASLDDERSLDSERGEFDEDDGSLSKVLARGEKETTTDSSSLSTAVAEGGEDDWEAMANEMTTWGTRLLGTLKPHFEVINRTVKTKRVRRQKYRIFLERCIARRHAKRAGKPNPEPKWTWPKERDLLYHTDLFVPLNLELKGIEEEGEDLHGLLTKQMEEAARTIGQNASWPLEEKRKLMLGLKQFYEQAVRMGPPDYDMFANHRSLDDDDFFTTSE